MNRKHFIIDGEKFADLEEFYQHVGDVLCPEFNWGKNLNAFNDILRGGFGQFEYDEPIQIDWIHIKNSKQVLGWETTVIQLRKVLEKSDSISRPTIQQHLNDALNFRGSTIYDWHIEIIMSHEHIIFHTHEYGINSDNSN